MADDKDDKKRFHHDVFISYAQEDKPVADAVCAKLEGKNIRCWIAPRDVPPGNDFPAAIIDGIEGGRIIVVIFSSFANNSPHVIRELTTAVNKGRIIIPFRIEDVVPSKSMEYLISVPHWLDAVTPPLEKHIDVLIETIECIIGPVKTSAAGIAQEPAEQEHMPETCPACSAPVPAGMKYCEECGAHITATALPLWEKLKTVDGSPYSPPSPEETVTTENENGDSGTKAAAEKSGGRPPMKLMAAGAVILVFLLILLAISQTGFPTSPVIEPNITVQETAPPDYGGLSEADYYRSTDAKVNTVVLTTEPTQTMTRDTELYLDASKDMSNAIVTVQFNGGPGTGLVNGNRVVLTRSDGTVAEGEINFRERLSSVRLQGSRGTDRIQVIITLHTGEEKTIIDKLLPYRQYY